MRKPRPAVVSSILMVSLTLALATVGCSHRRFSPSCDEYAGYGRSDRPTLLAINILRTSESFPAHIYLRTGRNGERPAFQISRTRWDNYSYSDVCAPLSEREFKDLLSSWRAVLVEAEQQGKLLKAETEGHLAWIGVAMEQGDNTDFLLSIESAQQLSTRPSLLRAFRQTVNLADSKVDWKILERLRKNPLCKSLSPDG